MNILLVSPQTPTTFGVSNTLLVFFRERKSAFPPLGLMTMAANASPVMGSQADRHAEKSLNLKTPTFSGPDYVMVGGMIVHKESVRDVAEPAG